MANACGGVLSPDFEETGSDFLQSMRVHCKLVSGGISVIKRSLYMDLMRGYMVMCDYKDLFFSCLLFEVKLNLKLRHCMQETKVMQQRLQNTSRFCVRVQ